MCPIGIAPRGVEAAGGAVCLRWAGRRARESLVTAGPVQSLQLPAILALGSVLLRMPPSGPHAY
jgi:hypothetical protein